MSNEFTNRTVAPMKHHELEELGLSVPAERLGQSWCGTFAVEVRAKTFTVELERVQKTATMFQVPFDLAEAFGRARRIAATVDRVASGELRR